jgi:hypothetical protein
MNEFQPIIDYVSRYITLTQGELNFFVSLLRIKNVKKKQFIVQPDFVCEYRSFIVEGLLRSYLVANTDKEYTVTIAAENGWISDLSSYTFQEPATLLVEALENSTLIQWSYVNEQLLIKTVPKFETFFRITSQNSSAMFQKRILAGLSMTAEERYEEFAKQFPNLLLRVPQHILASYLGMTTQFLSKIRNQKARKS